jgi:hypothetical protein
VYSPTKGREWPAGSLSHMVQRAGRPPSRADGDEHDDTGDNLNDELTHVSEGIGPESPDDRVNDGGGAGDQDSLKGGHIGEDL